MYARIIEIITLASRRNKLNESARGGNEFVNLLVSLYRSGLVSRYLFTSNTYDDKITLKKLKDIINRRP